MKIENNFLNTYSLKIGNILEFTGSGKRNITNLIYSNKYINIRIEGKMLNLIKDSFLNEINITREVDK